jgi:mannose-6-phosphate isomerase-like protein (cupin superfamily)
VDPEQTRRAEDAGDGDQPVARPLAQVFDSCISKEDTLGDYTITRLDEVDDMLGDYPGEMRMLTYGLDAEQVALTYRRMPQHTGGKGSYGHRHREQEEIYFVVRGKLQFKLGDDVVEAGRGTAVRVAPGTFRSVWNDEPEEAELVIVSRRVADPEADVEYQPDFWPE